MSWRQLLAIKEEAVQMVRQDLERPLVDCPVCGERLDKARGYINCPLGHYTATEGTTQQQQ